MRFNRTAISLVVASAVFSTDQVLAQAGSPGFALEEVVVTARKREESLQDTPISITAFTSNDLSKRQLTGLEDLDEATPNLSFDTGAPSSGSNSAVSVFIRGVGQHRANPCPSMFTGNSKPT